MGGLLKSTIIVTLFNLVGIALGFLSNLVIAGYFGAGAVMDVYMAATALPMFILSIITGSLNVTFIPIFAEYKNTKEIWKITSSILNIFTFITILIALIVIIAAKPIMSVLTPGFNNEKLSLAASLVRFQIPIIIFAAVNELMSGIYYSNQKFIVPLLNKVISPTITLVFVILFSKYVSVHSLIFASVIGMVIQTFVLGVGFFKKQNFYYQFAFDYKNAGVVKIFKLMLPLLAGMLFYRIIPLFDRFIASNLPEGSISYLGYSFKLYSQIPPLISTGIAMSLFPVFAIMAANKDWEGLKQNMSKSIRILLFVCLPIVFLFLLYPLPIIELLFQRGAFSPMDSFNTSLALSFYILALPVAVIGDVISKGYYVLQDTLTPAILGVAEVFIYFGVAYLLIPKFGYLSIPMAYAVYFNVSIVNAFIVRRKLGGKGGKTIVFSFMKHFLGCACIFGIFFLPIRSCNNLIVQNSLIVFAILFYFIFYVKVIKSYEAIYIWENIFVKIFKKVLNLKLIK